jgi:hypothetical protein
MIKKNCGSCAYFVKVPGYGICNKMDWRCGSDYGRSCKHWKGKKYERVKEVKHFPGKTSWLPEQLGDEIQ